MGISGRRVGKGTVWQLSHIQKEKVRIKVKIDTQGLSGKARLNFILKQIRSSEDEIAPVEQLRRYIYCMSVLVHHERWGGLTSRQVQNVYEMAKAILLIHGIAFAKSKLGFLHGDLHQVLSQIFRRNGKIWQSTWEQQFSNYAAQKSELGKGGLPLLALGIRLLRLGDADMAAEHFRLAESKGLSETSRTRARLELHKALRLLGRWEEAQKVFTDRKDLHLSQVEEWEFQWENHCYEVQRSADLESLLISCMPGKDHHNYSYLLDAFVWSRGVKTRNWLERFPKIRKLGRGLGENPRKTEGLWFECAEVIEKCYDSEIPYALRLEALGVLLGKSKNLFSVEQELLFLGAAVRWLVRNGSKGFGRLVLSEYRALNLRISGGKEWDVLNILSDLSEQPEIMKLAV